MFSLIQRRLLLSLIVLSAGLGYVQPVQASKVPPTGKVDNPALVKATQIAQQRARARSTNRCWRYVKVALLQAKVVESYPGTVYAKQAGGELSRNHGFVRIPVNCPFKAPVGSVIVYGGKGAGHVEFRTATGFVSDFKSTNPSRRPLLGVYVKKES